MCVVGIVGMPGSGKTEATKIARKKGFPIVKMGDVIREEVEKRDLDPTDKNMGKIATKLREKEGKDAIAKRCIDEVYSKIDSEENIVIIDGIRGWSEAKFFKKEFGDSFILVSIEAPFEERFNRIKKRNRKDDLSSKEELRSRDKREEGYSMKKAMEKADHVIKNNMSLKHYRKKISEFLEEVKK